MALNSEYNYNRFSVIPCCLTIIACLSLTYEVTAAHVSSFNASDSRNMSTNKAQRGGKCGRGLLVWLLTWKNRTIQKKSQQTASETQTPSNMMGFYNKSGSVSEEPIRVESSVEVCSTTWAAESHQHTLGLRFLPKKPQTPTNTALRYFKTIRTTWTTDLTNYKSWITAGKSCFITAKHQILYIRSVLWKLFTLQEPSINNQSFCFCLCDVYRRFITGLKGFKKSNCIRYL